MCTVCAAGDTLDLIDSTPRTTPHESTNSLVRHRQPHNFWNIFPDDFLIHEASSNCSAYLLTQLLRTGWKSDTQNKEKKMTHSRDRTTFVPSTSVDSTIKQRGHGRRLLSNCVYSIFRCCSTSTNEPTWRSLSASGSVVSALLSSLSLLLASCCASSTIPQVSNPAKIKMSTANSIPPEGAGMFQRGRLNR